MFWLKNTAFFRGCMVRAAYPEIGERWIRVLKRLGINAIVLPEERCCGSPLRNAGATEEYEENGRALREILERYHVGEIITACPACAHTLSQYAGV
ncbi:TPA: (Fe-S)-binding protein, partial [Candidatus Micrarchaeota archaeon]|nr:(Fe-S)-binding protein [Candidatus Micrarchaeota archaeon]